MKRRYLRPFIEKALVLIVIVQMLGMLCLDDFIVSFKSIMLIAINIAFLLINIRVLSKYGRNIFE